MSADPGAWTREVRYLVVLTGAGVSTGSGIPDFRGRGAVDSGPGRRGDSSRKRYAADPAVRARMWQALTAPVLTDARPGPAHLALARVRATIATQNVDGLHQAAGTPAARVHELHGTLGRARCTRCRGTAPMDRALRAIRAGAAEPGCPACGKATLRPDVVLFGEHPDRDVYGRAANAARGADLFLAVGTSLRVEPAAALCRIAVECGAVLVIVNDAPTPYDRYAGALVREPIEVAVPRIVEGLLAGGTPGAGDGVTG